MSHMIENAMRETNLTEEEAYFLLRFADRQGYNKAIKLLTNKPLRDLRRWFVWFGGWETAELSQWDRGAPAWRFWLDLGDRKVFNDPFPLSLFGHRITFYSGGWFQFKWGRGWVVALSRRARMIDGIKASAYWSPNGTPDRPQARVLLGTKKGGVQC